MIILGNNLDALKALLPWYEGQLIEVDRNRTKEKKTMDVYLTALKDVLVVIAPIVIAYISYRSNKKSRNDIKLEVEKITKEKEAETRQILDKIGAELESQKQLIVWQNSMPQTNEYLGLLNKKRAGHVSALPKLCLDINTILQSGPSVETLTELNQMLDRIELPKDDEDLFPHEVPIILDFRKLRREINEYLDRLLLKDAQQEETNHAHP